MTRLPPHPWRPPSRPVLLAAGLALTVPILVGAGTALAAEDPTMAGLPPWALPTGGTLGGAVLGAFLYAIITGKYRVSVQPAEAPDRRGEASGRRSDDDQAAALAKAREEGRAEGREEATMAERMATFDARLKALEDYVRGDQDRREKHQTAHADLDQRLHTLAATLGSLSASAR